MLLPLLLASPAKGMEALRGYCEEGNRPVVTSGLQSTTRVQASHPSCTVTVYVHGGGLATIYSDNNLTPLANPFTAQSNGQFVAYSANGRYDVTLASAGFSQTVTYSDIILCDPFEVGSTCNNGGATQAHNLLSTTHLDTMPASPPTRGDVITAQNQTSPSGVNPSWSRLPIGTNGQFLASDGVDVLWGTFVSGTGITISSVGGSTTITNTAPGSSPAYQHNNTLVASEPKLNFIDGTNIVYTVADDLANTRVNVTPNLAAGTLKHGLEFTIYNGGTALTGGTTPASYALMATVPFACTIVRYSLAADQGTATVKFWKVATGTAIPAVGNSINTSGVSLSSGTKIDSTTLSDFTTTSIALNDSIIMDITAVAGGMTYLDGVLGCQE